MHFLPKKGSFTAVGTYIGTVVGVGIFGLPYVFSQTGYVIGLIELVIVAVIIGILSFMYAELTIQTPGHHRFVTYMERFLGPSARRISIVIFLTMSFGSLLAFTILGGQFVQNAFPFFPTWLASCVLLLAVASVSWGGFQVVSRLEIAVIVLMLVLFGIIIFSAVPSIHLSNLLVTSGDPFAILRPLGVIMFSLSGLNAIPEMHDLLGRRSKELPNVLMLASLLIVVLYASFTFAVVGVTGIATTPDAISGLAQELSPAMSFLGVMLGVVAVFSIFTEMSTALTETLRIDFRLSHPVAWFVTFAVPLVLFLLGVRTFVGVIGFVGSICTGLMGILVVLAYEKMKKRKEGVPSFLSYTILAVFLFGILVEVLYTLFH